MSTKGVRGDVRDAEQNGRVSSQNSRKGIRGVSSSEHTISLTQRETKKREGKRRKAEREGIAAKLRSIFLEGIIRGSHY